MLSEWKKNLLVFIVQTEMAKPALIIQQCHKLDKCKSEDEVVVQI